MLSTVQPDRKLMVDTLAMFRASRAGLMMTPPPMPQMAPPTEAKKLTSNKKTTMVQSSSRTVPSMGGYVFHPSRLSQFLGSAHIAGNGYTQRQIRIFDNNL